MNKKVSILIPIHKNKIWLQDRVEDDQTKLEFPGGKIELSETPLEAVIRETKEEVGVELNIEKIQYFKDYQFNYPDFSVEIEAFLYHDLELEFEESGYKSAQLMLADLSGMNYGQNLQIIEDLCKFLQEFTAS